MELRIKLLCKGCGTVHDMDRKEEDGEESAIACNWCPNCEDKADDYYHEWYIAESELPIVDNPAQLKLF